MPDAAVGRHSAFETVSYIFGDCIYQIFSRSQGLTGNRAVYVLGRSLLLFEGRPLYSEQLNSFVAFQGQVGFDVL